MAGFTLTTASVTPTKKGTITNANVAKTNKTALGLMRVWVTSDGYQDFVAEAKILNKSLNNAIIAYNNCMVENPTANQSCNFMIFEGSISANATVSAEASDSNEETRQIIFKASDGDYGDGKLIVKISGYTGEIDITLLVAIQNDEDGAGASTNIALKETITKQKEGAITYEIPFTVGALS
jgi:hypothetical protein